MKKTISAFAAALVLFSASGSAQDKLYSNEFPIGDVTLLEGPFKAARDLNIEVLLQYDVDRLMAPFRAEAGLQEKSPRYPNWAGLDGHVAGHYLTALAISYGSTGNQECLDRMNYIIAEATEVAQANAANHPEWGKGYIGGVPNSEGIWTDFKKGEFGKYHSAWVPFYNIHKMYAGLRDAWVYCGNEQALKLFMDFCDWGLNLTADLSDEQMEGMLRTEYGGMNEMYADAYAITGEEKYLREAKRFSHKFILEPLSQDIDNLDNLHANTQVPKAVGFARIAEVSGDPQYAEASRFFWETVTKNRSLASGGNSRREHFPSVEACIDFVTDDDGPETCNTYNMLKLTEDLFRMDPKAEYADYYERAMFNHILSTQHPEHGGYVYFTSARPRHYRTYSAPNQAMWCCVGSGMENHAKYNQFIYTHGKKDLYVNLFVASELKWKEKGITLRQETSFPDEEKTTLNIVEGKKRFTLKVRYPGWVAKGQLAIKVNGRKVRVKGEPSSYVSIRRRWKAGDKVEVSLPMANTIEHLPNVPDYIAFMHGPILLGMKTGTEDLAGLIADDGRWGQTASGKKLPITEAPIIICNDIDNLGDHLVPVEGKPLHFKLDTKVINAIDAEIEPFHDIHDSRYMMYWLALTEDGYQEYIDSLAAVEHAKIVLEERSLDSVAPGEQQPEADHKMLAERSNKGVTNDVFYRDALPKGYFSYEFATQGVDTDVTLYVKYWGFEWNPRKFTILIDDTEIASVDNRNRWRTGQFKTEEYAVPQSVLAGKSKVRIKFQAGEDSFVSAVYEVRLLKK